MKYIFLDLDGVLRNYKSDLEWSKKLDMPILKGTKRLFSNRSVDLLNEVIYLTNARIVLTSNWRLKLNLDDLRLLLKERGIIGIIEGVTITLLCDNSPIPIGHKGLEILKYLQSKKINNNNYVVIDDQISDIKEFIPIKNIVKVNPAECLTSENINDILNILL